MPGRYAISHSRATPVAVAMPDEALNFLVHITTPHDDERPAGLT